MKYLGEIATFPADSARVLETRYGIATAESFYEHAVRDPAGVLAALGLKNEVDLKRLMNLVEIHLAPSFIRSAQGPPFHRLRGALDPGDRRKRSCSAFDLLVTSIR